MVLAGDPIHDLKRALVARPPAELLMNETKSSASSVKATTYSETSVRVASRIQA